MNAAGHHAKASQKHIMAAHDQHRHPQLLQALNACCLLTCSPTQQACARWSGSWESRPAGLHSSLSQSQLPCLVPTSAHVCFA